MLPQGSHDLRYALRALLRAPAFSVTVLATLALAIGANLAIFSVVRGVLFRPLPFTDPERLVQLANGDAAATLSAPELVDLRRDGAFFSSVGAYAFADGNLVGGDGDAERVRAARVDAGFFRTLAPRFAAGRGLTAEEDRAGGADAVVISHALWMRRFGGRPAAIGSTLVLNDAPRTIVGVLPAGFEYPAATVDVWVPLRLDPSATSGRNNHSFRTLARLAPGQTLASADAAMGAMRDRWAADHPQAYRADDPLQVDVRPIRDRIVGSTAPFLVALFGAVGFVLLIACVNVANLLLVRAEARRRELAVRAALGASRQRLAMQLASEGALLTLLGTALGLAAAWPTVRLLVAAAPVSIPRVGEIRLDAGALLWAAAICAVATVLFTLAPLVQGARVAGAESLAVGARGASGGRRARRVRSALVILEVALAVVMLTGAGLFVRTILDLGRTDLGFDTEGLLTARISLPPGGYRDPRGADLTAAFVERVRALPGVRDASAMAWTPIVAGGGNWSLSVESRPTADVDDSPTASPQQVTPRFFETLGIPLRRGRTFTAADRRGAEPVVIVNETLARELWGAGDAIDQRLRMTAPGMPYARVVGVVGDTRVDGIAEPAPGVMYFPHEQASTTAYFTSLSMTLLVRTPPGTPAPVAAIREVLRELDPRIPLSDVRTMGEVVESTIATQRFTTGLLVGLATGALLLASLGIYGVMAYGVTLRRVEFGIRLALGAEPWAVVRLVLREGLLVALVGLAVGIGGAFALDRLLRSVLEGIAPLGLGVSIGVSCLLLTVALCAAGLPARIAARTHPMTALRGE